MHNTALPLQKRAAIGDNCCEEFTHMQKNYRSFLSPNTTFESIANSCCLETHVLMMNTIIDIYDVFHMLWPPMKSSPPNSTDFLMPERVQVCLEKHMENSGVPQHTQNLNTAVQVWGTLVRSSMKSVHHTNPAFARTYFACPQVLCCWCSTNM